jgi:hypothetical protein
MNAAGLMLACQSLEPQHVTSTAWSEHSECWGIDVLGKQLLRLECSSFAVAVG